MDKKCNIVARGNCRHQGSAEHVASESNTHPFLGPLNGRGVRRWDSVLRVVQLLDRVQVGEVWVLPADACAVLRKLLAGGRTVQHKLWWNGDTVSTCRSKSKCQNSCEPCADAHLQLEEVWVPPANASTGFTNSE